MTSRNVLSESLEDYLESIFFTIEKKRAARAKDISKRLQVNASSVTGALHALSDRGFINYAPYDVITLTDKGARAAREIARRHGALRDFFVRVLRVEPEAADEAACRVEHAMPRGILGRLIQFIEFIETCPRGGEAWIQGFEKCRKGGYPPVECEACVARCLASLRDRAATEEESA